MKVQLRAFLPFLLLFVILARTASAQTALTVTNATIGSEPTSSAITAESMVPWLPEYFPAAQATFTPAGYAPAGHVPAGHPGYAPLAAADSLTYFDWTAPTHDWVFPFQAGTTLYVIAAAERFTLPTVDGYLDSINFLLDAVVGDSLTIAIYPDTTITTGAGPFHFVNIFSPTAQPFAELTIPITPASSSVNLKLRLPHVHVTKNFHAVLFPRIVNNAGTLTATSQFLIRGDSEAVHTPTTANAHSTFIGINLQGGSKTAGIMDGYFTPSGDVGPLYCNFAITAYVSTASGASVDVSPDTFSDLQVFPNPATSEVTLTLPSKSGPATVELRDILGRTVSTSMFTGTGSLDVSHLLPGRYEAIAHSGGSVWTSPVIIHR